MRRDYDSLPDEQIVQLIRHGEREAYLHIVRRYQDRLRLVLYSYCQSTDEAEETLQETFVKGYTSLGGYEPSGPLYGWLKAIGLNILRKEVRRKGLVERQSSAYLRQILSERLDRDPSGDTAEEHAVALRHCLGKLSKRQRAILAARYEEDRPFGEIARSAGVNAEAVRLRLFRIREALRKCIRSRLAPAKA